MDALTLRPHLRNTHQWELYLYAINRKTLRSLNHSYTTYTQNYPNHPILSLPSRYNVQLPPPQTEPTSKTQHQLPPPRQAPKIVSTRPSIHYPPQPSYLSKNAADVSRSLVAYTGLVCQDIRYVRRVVCRLHESFYLRTPWSSICIPYKFGACSNRWLGGGWEPYFDIVNDSDGAQRKTRKGRD